MVASISKKGGAYQYRNCMNRSKRKAIRSYPTEQSGLCTPAAIKSPPAERGEEGERGEAAKCSVLQLVQCARLMDIFKESVARFKGTNEPVSYRQEYDFAEKWEETSKVRYDRNDNLLLSANSPCLALAILVMLHKVPLIWYLSVQQVFGVADAPSWFASAILVIIADLLLKVYLQARERAKGGAGGQRREAAAQVAQLVAGDAFTLAVLGARWAGAEGSAGLLVCDFAAVALQGVRFYEIYSSVCIILITYKYKNYVNLIGFISKMLVILHFFSILIYALTFLHPEDNWLQAIGKAGEDAVSRYIESMYFIATTMFTVGYGDVLPRNYLEISVIILVQLLGIILNGYIVNEIGHILSTIRQNQEEFEQDIQNTDQICEYYQLNEDLKHRVRNYIVNNQLANEELNINEENQFLMKLNEELRNEVKHANQLQIIKTSLFFLCNWSKKMQAELSKKLEKFIFSPNERILSKDKLFIVTKGKIDLYIERKLGSKVYVKKHLKTVERPHHKEVFSNVFGYVSLFTDKPSRLTAVSKDFAICYALDFAEILDIVKDDERDFEYYHETRTNLSLEKLPEKFEVPNLINNRQHYCPTKWVVLQRNKKSLMSTQERSQYLRSQRKKKTIVVEEKDAEVEESDSDCFLSVEEMSIKEKTPVEKKGKLAKEKRERECRNSPAFVSFRSYRRKHYFKTVLEDKQKEEELRQFLTTQVVLTSYFEVGKSYSKYFKKGNRENVLSRINKDEIKEFHPINSKVISMEWLDLIIFSNKVAGKDTHNPRPFLF